MDILEEFNLVVFEEKEFFFNNEPLECRFSLNAGMQPNAADCVAIFKVAFQTVKEHLCSSLINTIADNKGTIVFTSKHYFILSTGSPQFLFCLIHIFRLEILLLIL